MRDHDDGFHVFHQTGNGFYEYQYQNAGHYVATSFLVAWAIESVKAFLAIIWWLIVAAYYVARILVVGTIDLIFWLRTGDRLPGHWYLGGPSYEMPTPEQIEMWHDDLGELDENW